MLKRCFIIITISALIILISKVIMKEVSYTYALNLTMPFVRGIVIGALVVGFIFWDIKRSSY